jgi:hypothetical protein
MARTSMRSGPVIMLCGVLSNDPFRLFKFVDTLPAAVHEA